MNYGNDYQNEVIALLGNVDTSLTATSGSNATTSYGETATASNNPFIQSEPVYNLLPANFRAFTSGSGTAGVEDQKFKTTTGTSVGGYGAIQSFRATNSKAGQTVVARFSGYFENNVATSWQGMGLVNLGDEVSFGYNGTNFGVWHRYGGIAEVRTVNVTGAAGGSETLTLTLNGTAYSIPLTSGTVQHNAHEIADWLNSNQSVWHADQLDDDVIISAASDGAKSGAYTFSSSTATGTITQNTAGVTKTSDFIAETSWNGTEVIIDPSRGNAYQITYQHGFGQIEYAILDPTTNVYVKVHTISVQNSGTTLSFSNPSLHVGCYCVSLGSTTDLAVYMATVSAFTQGNIAPTRNPRAFANTQTVTTTHTNILTIRNRRTYNNRINQVEIRPYKVSIANESTKNVEVQLRASSNLGIEKNFQTIGNNLITDIDTTTGEVTGGRLLASFVLGGGQSNTFSLRDLDITLPPTLRFVVQARVTSGSSASVSASLIWLEDL